MNQTKIKSALAALCLMFTITASAQTTVTHTVERGETVASIAKKYNVTPQDIINANPDAAEFVFAGMKLEIPANTKNKIKEKENVKELHDNSDYLNNATVQETKNIENNGNKSLIQVDENEDDKTGKIEGAMEFAFPSIGSLQGDNAEQYKMTLGLQTSMGAKIYITNSLFAEAQIGYRYLQTSWKKKYAEAVIGKYGDIKLSTHSIYFPLYFGACLKDFTFKFGPYCDYIISGKEKAENHSTKFSEKKKIKDDKLSVGLNFCVRYKMYGVKFNIGLTNYAGIKDCKEMAAALVIGI